MNEITCHNTCGLCIEQYCNEVETNFIRFNLNGIELFLAFCDEHGEAFWKAEREEESW